MSNQRDDKAYVSIVLSSVMSLMGILLAVLGILIGIHGSYSSQSYITLYTWMIDGTVIAILLCGIVSGLSVAYLRGCAVSVRTITSCLAVLIGGVPLGTAFLVAVAVHHTFP